MEINNQFLKDGLRIILPPDLDVDPGICSIQNLKKTHADLYSKRDSILKNFNPVYLFGVDRIGKNIFSENISGNITTSRSEEDFWNTFNLYSMARVGSSGEVGDSGDGDGDKSEVKRVWNESREPAVFSSEVRLLISSSFSIDKYWRYSILTILLGGFYFKILRSSTEAMLVLVFGS